MMMIMKVIVIVMTSLLKEGNIAFLRRLCLVPQEGKERALYNLII